jgi:hypothetical protein
MSENVEKTAPKKRVRKPVKKLVEIVEEEKEEQIPITQDENVVLSIVESSVTTTDATSTESTASIFVEQELTNSVINETTTESTIVKDESDDSLLQKKGRKPKGGKIIQQLVPTEENKKNRPTVILHLKCFMKDLQQQQSTQFDSYQFTSSDMGYSMIQPMTEPTHIYINNGTMNSNNANIKTNSTGGNDSFMDETSYTEKDNDMKEVWKKLKQLEHSLHVNNIGDKKSACFWCTCDFDNPPIYIPKYFLKSSYHVYGCFCSPECSVAYLMNEHIDSSARFERYHLLNHIYAKIYDYKKNIKPAPNPYYMLEKYYGNLSIQEYRALLSNERLFLVVDKPLTRIMPELHQDNEEHIISNRKVIASNTQNAKKKIQRKVQTKSNIVNDIMKGGAAPL